MHDLNIMLFNLRDSQLDHHPKYALGFSTTMSNMTKKPGFIALAFFLVSLLRPTCDAFQSFRNTFFFLPPYSTHRTMSVLTSERQTRLNKSSAVPRYIELLKMIGRFLNVTLPDEMEWL